MKALHKNIYRLSKVFLLLPVVAGLARATSWGLPIKLNFTGVHCEHVIPLSELGSGLPTDWTPYEYLVLEFRASSSQRFDLGLKTDTGNLLHRIGPFPNVWVRASIPLRYYRKAPGAAYDMAATYNQPRNSYWINIHSGKFGPTTNVQGLVIRMDYPVGNPSLEIRSVRLAKEDPGDDILEKKPIVDEFGQYIHVDWPGKAKSLAALKNQWAQEEEHLRSILPTNRCPYGGFLGTTANATGFFRVEKINGRWWFICPDGHLFFSVGVNGVRPSSPTRVEGRMDYFEKLPPNLEADSPGRGGQMKSFYTWNVYRRFGVDWRAKWAELNTLRLQAWRFNTMHNWGIPSPGEPNAKVPWAAMLRAWQLGKSIMGMPDVYADDFEARVDSIVAQQLAPFKDDPWMIGYFIGNEPPWPGQESRFCEEVLAGPPTKMQTRLKEFLANGDTPARRKQFVIETFNRYLQVICAATKKYAPNHLNLGIRFGGIPHEEVLREAQIFDVVSINIYSYAPSRKALDRIYSITQRPILIGEFHIGAPECGMAPGLVQAMNQHERGVAYRYYVEQAAAHPAVLGTHWFQWIDQPATGRFDGENYNIGFIDVTDRPYQELVQAAIITHDRIYKVHAGEIPPFDTLPRASEAGHAAK